MVSGVANKNKYLLHPSNTTFLVWVSESQLFRYDNPVSTVVVELGFVSNVLNWISVVFMVTWLSWVRRSLARAYRHIPNLSGYDIALSVGG